MRRARARAPASRPVTGQGVRITVDDAPDGDADSRSATRTSRCSSTGCGRPAPRRSRSTASGSPTSARSATPGEAIHVNYRPLTPAVRRRGDRRHRHPAGRLRRDHARQRGSPRWPTASASSTTWTMSTSCRCRRARCGRCADVTERTPATSDARHRRRARRDRRPRAARSASCSGCSSSPTCPLGLEPYLPIAVVAALDAVFGGLRAFLDGIFDDKVFVVSFVSNVVIAAAIVYLGDQLGVGGQLVDRRHRRARHPDLLQRRRHPPAPVPCLTPADPPTPSPAPRPGPRPSDAVRPSRRAAHALRKPLAAARSSSAVLLAVLGFAAVVQVRANEADDTYAGCASSDLIDVLDGLAGTAERAEARDRPARGRPATSCSDEHQRAAGRARAGPAARPRPSASWPALVPVTGPGRADHHRRGDRPGQRRLAARHASRSCATAGAEAMRVQRPGPGRSPRRSFEDAVGGIERRRPAARAAVRHRRDRRPAHAAHGALDFPAGPDRALETVRRRHGRGRGARRGRHRRASATPSRPRATPSPTRASSLPRSPTDHDATDRGDPCTPRT